MSPLIVRRVGAFAAPWDFETVSRAETGEADPFKDVKLFLVGWLGGLVFFGTWFF